MYNFIALMLFTMLLYRCIVISLRRSVGYANLETGCFCADGLSMLLLQEKGTSWVLHIRSCSDKLERTSIKKKQLINLLSAHTKTTTYTF